MWSKGGGVSSARSASIDPQETAAGAGLAAGLFGTALVRRGTYLAFASNIDRQGNTDFLCLLLQLL